MNLMLIRLLNVFDFNDRDVAAINKKTHSGQKAFGQMFKWKPSLENIAQQKNNNKQTNKQTKTRSRKNLAFHIGKQQIFTAAIC